MIARLKRWWAEVKANHERRATNITTIILENVRVRERNRHLENRLDLLHRMLVSAKSEYDHGKITKLEPLLVDAIKTANIGVVERQVVQGGVPS